MYQEGARFMHKKRDDSRPNPVQRQSEDKTTKGHGVPTRTSRKDIDEAISKIESDISIAMVENNKTHCDNLKKILNCLKNIKKKSK